MVGTISEFRKLTDAEQYFEFFDLAYDPQVVNINRLHILKKFSQSLEEIDTKLVEAAEEQKLSFYREALENSYATLQTSNAIEQKLFKVFHQKPHNVVMLGDIGNDDEEE
ncbi:nitrogenase-stabilizing/protective protein NifW [Pseudanabaena sp. ABRG5-3]|uniref:nitrogenase-stabilizing/protective protein NifW n=1 Tax=Pseudanabaena sp. ABRG5-3 TaxID=685565 RepID=UPI000DC71F3A|nr:nitrogenase-stabilizing/protective protein NifW [Pseudanabaena sp. ABRG5-3]BBC26997.1 nitrogen fixation protein [Pseudanabaena sp. ABRG5-3]